MHITVRRFLFAFFVLAFVVAAPLVVLYTAGYRLNISNRRLQQTGVLAINTMPRGSSIILNGQGLAQKTPYVVQRLMPNTHDVSLQKKGYHSWQERVTVEEGKTAYITARLFADSQPIALSAAAADIALRDRKANFDADYVYTQPDQNIILFDNGANVEVRSGLEPEQTLIGLLPQGVYQILEADNEYLLLTDSGQTAFVVARQGGAVVELPTKLSAYDWLENDNLLVWTDGTEVSTFDALSGEKTFLTRDGQRIVDVAWHPEADSLFIATADTLTAYDRSVYEARETITLLSAVEIFDIWLDAGGKNLYYLTAPLDDNVTTVIYELPLTL